MLTDAQIDAAFQLLLGRAPLAEELRAYAALEASPRQLGERLMATDEFRRHALNVAGNAGVESLARENADLSLRLLFSSRANAELVAQRNALLDSPAWRAGEALRSRLRQLPAPVRGGLARAARLARRRPATHGPAPSAPMLAARRPAVLMVDDRWPEPDRDSGSLDAVNMVRDFVAMGFAVVYGVAKDAVQEERYRQGLAALGAEVLPRSGLVHVQRHIDDTPGAYAVVVLARVHYGGRLFESVRHTCPDAKVIFNTVDLHYVREQRAAALMKDPAAARRAEEVRVREQFLVAHAHLTVVVSETERDMLAAAIPGARVLHLPLTRDILPPKAPFSARKGIGFVGGFHHLPNIDAVNWFLADIWPLVRAQMPDAEFFIAGSNLPKGVARKEDGVTYLGPVDDLHGWFETLVMSVAPLRVGAGAKGKVASSLCSGLPCVVSEVAAEGMNLVDGENVMVATDPRDFADTIVSLCRDQALWERLSAGAVQVASTQLSHAANLLRLNDALLGMGVDVPKNQRAAGEGQADAA